MTKVAPLASPRAGDRMQAHALPPTAATAATAPTAHHLAPDPSPIARQAAIENALTMALYFVRQPGDSAANLWAATARVNRAFTLLKQASQAHPLATNFNARKGG